MSLSLLSQQRCHSSQYWSKQTKTSRYLAVTMKWWCNHPRVKRGKTMMMMMMSRVANLHLWIWIEDSLKCLKRPPLLSNKTAIIDDNKVNKLNKTNLTHWPIKLSSESPRQMQRSSMKTTKTTTLATGAAKFSTWETKRYKLMAAVAICEAAPLNKEHLTCTSKLLGKRIIAAGERRLRLPVMVTKLSRSWLSQTRRVRALLKLLSVSMTSDWPTNQRPHVSFKSLV